MNKKIQNLIKLSFQETIEKTFYKNDESKKHFYNKDNVLEPDEINFSTEFSRIFQENSKKEEEEFFTISEFKYKFLKENHPNDEEDEEDSKEIKDSIKKFDKDKKMYFDSFSFNKNESIIFEFKKNPHGIIKKNSFIDLMRIIYLMKYEQINYGVIGAFPNDKNKINKNIILEENLKIDCDVFKNFKDIAKYSLSVIGTSKENQVLILESKLNKNLDHSFKDDILEKILETDLIWDQIKNYAEDVINNNKNFLNFVKDNKFFIFIEKFYPKNKNSSYKEQLAPGVINSIINKIKIEDLIKIFTSINNNNSNNNIFKKEFFNQDIFENHYIPKIFQTELNNNENEIFAEVLDKIKNNTWHLTNIFKRNLKYKKDDKNIDDTIYYFNNRTSIIISSWNTILNNKIHVKGKKYKYIDLEKSWYEDETEEDKKIKLFELGFKSIIVVGLYAYFLDQVGSDFIKKYEEIKGKNKKINELIKKWSKINNKKSNIDNNIDILDFDDVEIFLDRIIEIVFLDNE